MNTSFIRYNLQEIQEELEVISSGLSRGEAYRHEDFYRSMQHVIHHVNIAWNARNASPAEVEEGSLQKWSGFPKDIQLI